MLIVDRCWSASLAGCRHCQPLEGLPEMLSGRSQCLGQKVRAVQRWQGARSCRHVPNWLMVLHEMLTWSEAGGSLFLLTSAFRAVASTGVTWSCLLGLKPES